MRRMRKQRELTQCPPANASGDTQPLIRKAEKGGRLDIATVQNLAEASSQFGESVSVSSLRQHNPATAGSGVQDFDRFGKRRFSRTKPGLPFQSLHSGVLNCAVL